MKTDKNTIIVAIHCLVYNHGPYLRDCLEGFVMQKTNFRFVAIVHEDASTDNSAAIIREYADKYPDIIKPIFETENQWSKHDSSLGRIINDAIAATGAKYIAKCEGDDYWTDPYKLQKQVDFMEAHCDFVACFHNVRVFNGRTYRLFNDVNENHYPSTEDIIIRHWFIATASLFYRNNIITFPSWTNGIINGDYLLELLLAREGKFYYMDDVMAVYRQEGQGISTTLNSHKTDLYDKLIYLLRSVKEMYPENYATVFDESIANYNKMKEDNQKELYYDSHPLLKAFRPKTYRRMIKQWMRRKVNSE